MLDTLKKHWPEYFMEAAELGIFMISACCFGVLLEHPASPLHEAITDPFVRRILSSHHFQNLRKINLIITYFASRNFLLKEI